MLMAIISSVYFNWGISDHHCINCAIRFTFDRRYYQKCIVASMHFCYNTSAMLYYYSEMVVVVYSSAVKHSSTQLNNQPWCSKK